MTVSNVQLTYYLKLHKIKIWQKYILNTCTVMAVQGKAPMCIYIIILQRQ